MVNNAMLSEAGCLHVREVRGPAGPRLQVRAPSRVYNGLGHHGRDVAAGTTIVFINGVSCPSLAAATAVVEAAVQQHVSSTASRYCFVPIKTDEHRHSDCFVRLDCDSLRRQESVRPSSPLSGERSKQPANDEGSIQAVAILTGLSMALTSPGRCVVKKVLDPSKLVAAIRIVENDVLTAVASESYDSWQDLKALLELAAQSGTSLSFERPSRTGVLSATLAAASGVALKVMADFFAFEFDISESPSRTKAAPPASRLLRRRDSWTVADCF
jgi:hypothetical protein